MKGKYTINHFFLPFLALFVLSYLNRFVVFFNPLNIVSVYCTKTMFIILSLDYAR